MGEWGESIDLKKMLGFLWEGGGRLGKKISASQSNCEVLWFSQEVGRCEVATCRCGKNEMGRY